MKVTEKEVTYVADLANLDLSPEERSRMVRDLNSILGFVDTLNELDTSNVPPMAQVMTVSFVGKGKCVTRYSSRRCAQAFAEP